MQKLSAPPSRGYFCGYVEKHTLTNPAKSNEHSQHYERHPTASLGSGSFREDP